MTVAPPTSRGRLTDLRSHGRLDAAGLRATHPPSSITLGGLLKHLARVEDGYSSRRLLGRDMPAPWHTVDWGADRDWVWHSAAEDPPSSS